MACIFLELLRRHECACSDWMYTRSLYDCAQTYCSSQKGAWESISSNEDGDPMQRSRWMARVDRSILLREFGTPLVFRPHFPRPTYPLIEGISISALRDLGTAFHGQGRTLTLDIVSLLWHGNCLGSSRLALQGCYSRGCDLSYAL